MENIVIGCSVLLYLGVIAFLGYLGYRRTRSTDDFLLAGRQAHPFVMALSYGAAFISTSAIIGFGGFAAAFGMSLLWLVFANIFFGIFIAFIFFGKPTRRLGMIYKAQTFPELMGKFYDSRFMHGLMALIIVLFMPLYASAVLIAAARYIEASFALDYNVAVGIFSVLIAVYVICGGLKGVMYADAFQGTIMFIGMFLLIMFAYGKMGGVIPTHEKLSQLPTEITTTFDEKVVPVLAKELGKTDLTHDEALAFLVDAQAEQKSKAKEAALLKSGEKSSVADSQAVALFKQLKEDPELGAAIDNEMILTKISGNGFQGWTKFPKTGSKLFFVILTSIICGVGIGALAQPQLAVRYMTVKSDRELHRAVMMGGIFICCIVGVAYLVGSLTNVWFYSQDGRIAWTSVADMNIDKIIPTFINRALPQWFGVLFMLTLLSAAMSTLSSLFHTMGTALGRDLIERAILNRESSSLSMIISRLGVLASLIVTVALSFLLPPGIVAIATSTFFGLCAVAFLPLYVCALYWKRATKAGAIASLTFGFLMSFFWMTFIQMPKGEIPAILSNLCCNVPSLLPEPWRFVDVIVIVLPLSFAVMIIVSLLTQPKKNSENM